MFVGEVPEGGEEGGGGGVAAAGAEHGFYEDCGEGVGREGGDEVVCAFDVVVFGEDEVVGEVDGWFGGGGWLAGDGAAVVGFFED